MQFVDRNIIVTSNEPWGDIWFSKQNYANELSKRNKVYFLNPPSKWKLSNLFSNKYKLMMYNENLTIINYENPLPILNKFFYAVNNRIVSYRFKKYFEKNKADNIILWAFDPFRLSNPLLLGVKLSIFHSVDLYEFRNYGEVELAKKVDYVFCVSEKLFEQYNNLNRKVFYVPHGIAASEFKADDDPEYSKSIMMSDYGLYVGNIDNRINMSLLEKMLVRFPEIKFVFIGKKQLTKENEASTRIFVKNQYKNLYYIEPIHFKKLKYYIAKSKFCLSIMNRHYPGNTISHHKILQYLALGKPMFGCEMPGYTEKKEIAYLSDEDDTVLAYLDGFLMNGERDELKEKRIELAYSHNFETILKDVEKIINL